MPVTVTDASGRAVAGLFPEMLRLTLGVPFMAFGVETLAAGALVYLVAARAGGGGPFKG